MTSCSHTTQFKTRLSKATLTWAKLFRNVTVTKVDDSTVSLRLVQPFAPLLARLAVGILPAHLLDGLDAGGLYSAPFNQQPVGTGPFQVTEVASDHVDLAANSSYYFGEPSIDWFELRLYPDDASLLKALKQNEVQGAFFRTSLSSVDRYNLATNHAWEVLQLPSTISTVLFFNNTAPPLEDKNIRQALAYATDRAKIIIDSANDQGVLANSAIPNGTWAYSAVLDRYPFDPAEAGRLLDEDGWTLQENGVRANNGLELRLKIVTNDDPQRLAIAQAVAEGWSAIGIPTEVSTQGPTTLLRDTLTPRLFLVALYGFDSGPDPDPYPGYHTSQARPGGNNLSGFSNPEADLILQNARQTTDPADRLSLYRQFQEIFASELPTLPLFQRTYTYVIDRHLENVGLPVLFDSSSRFVNVREWRLNGG